MESESLTFPGLLQKYRELFLRLFSNSLRVDLALTLVFCVLWLLFSWQYGFHNSPDSWFRGVLGKSIAQGRPFFINLKQGWLYEYGAWHHDATHEPLLPFLYALFFIIFGNKIIIANIISTLSAGVLLFPLLRLSRKLLGNPLPAFFLCALLPLNKELGYLFEVTAGLSLPTLLLAMVFFLFFIWKMLGSERPGWAWGAVLSIVAYYYVRSAAQLMFFWVMLCTLVFARSLLGRADFLKLRRMWGISFLFVLPWMLRKLILFSTPFFSHITPMLWTDRAYDLWSYHEQIPLPSPAAYFQNHTFQDFLVKVLIKGPVNFYVFFDRVATGPFWAYGILFLLSAVFILRRLADPRKKFIYLTLWAFLAGYAGIYSLIPGLETRYFIPLYFILVFTILSAVFLLRLRTVFYLGLMVVLIGVAGIDLRHNYFPFSFYTSDRALAQDPLVGFLKDSKIDRQDVILGPFADVQRLAFATGLTFIEEPDNLKQLKDPAGLFRKYNIRYSLVDIRNILPEEMISDTKMAGDRLLFTVGGVQGASNKSTSDKSTRDKREPEISKSVQQGVRRRMVFLDSYYSDAPADLSLFTDLKTKIFVSYGPFADSREKLFDCGLLIMRYGQGMPELSDEDYAVLDQFIAAGGRVLLLCPAWVWLEYEKKGLASLPYYRIAKKYGLLLAGRYVDPPLVMANPAFGKKGSVLNLDGTFSEVLCKDGFPLLTGGNGRVAAAAAVKGDSRIIVWAQNNFFSDLALTPQGKKFTKDCFNWLFKL